MMRPRKRSTETMRLPVTAAAFVAMKTSEPWRASVPRFCAELRHPFGRARGSVRRAVGADSSAQQLGAFTPRQRTVERAERQMARGARDLEHEAVAEFGA